MMAKLYDLVVVRERRQLDVCNRALDLAQAVLTEATLDAVLRDGIRRDRGRPGDEGRYRLEVRELGTRRVLLTYRIPQVGP